MHVAANLAAIRRRIDECCDEVGRSRETVSLLAVSKTVDLPRIEAAYQAGQRLFGESRQQEAESKVASLPSDVEWHFIGKLQRNKVRKVLTQFSVIHSIDSPKLARHVDRIASELGLKPKVFLEVNIASETSKSGFEVDELKSEFEALSQLEHLDIAGLMAIPPDEEDPARAAEWLRRVREVRDDLQSGSGLVLKELSMGMSGDYEEAIRQGSTLVRIGSSIFGERSYSIPA